MSNTNNIFSRLLDNDLKLIPEINSEFSDSSPLLLTNFRKRKPLSKVQQANFCDKINENMENNEKNRKPVNFRNIKQEKENVLEVYKPKTFTKKTKSLLKRFEKPNFSSFKLSETSISENFFEKNPNPKTSSRNKGKISPEPKLYTIINLKKKPNSSNLPNSLEIIPSQNNGSLKKVSFSNESKKKPSILTLTIKRPSFFKEVKLKNCFNVFERKLEKDENRQFKNQRKTETKKDQRFFEDQYNYFKQKQLQQKKEIERTKALVTLKELKECTFKPKIHTNSYSKQTKYLTLPNRLMNNNNLDLAFEKEKENCTFSPKINAHRSKSPRYQEVKNEKKTIERLQKARWETKLKSQLEKKGCTSNEKIKKGLHQEIMQQEKREFEKIRIRKKSLDKLSEGIFSEGLQIYSCFFRWGGFFKFFANKNKRKKYDKQSVNIFFSWSDFKIIT